MQKSFIPNSLTYKGKLTSSELFNVVWFCFHSFLFHSDSIVVVNTLWKEGRIDEAFAAIEDMERCGIVGSAAVYYDLAICLCSAGGCNEALIQVKKKLYIYAMRLLPYKQCFFLCVWGGRGPHWLGGIVPSKVPLGESFNDCIVPGKRYSFRQVIHQQRVLGRKVSICYHFTFKCFSVYFFHYWWVSRYGYTTQSSCFIFEVPWKQSSLAFFVFKAISYEVLN